MSEFRVANRYALALISPGEETAELEAATRDLELIDNTIRSSRELLLLLRSPVIRVERKDAVLAVLFEKHVAPSTVRFLCLLTEKGREGLLPDIIKRFFELKDEREGIANVSVRVAVPIAKQQENAFINKLTSWAGKHVRLRVEVDPSIIGGFVARVGDTVLDASIRHQLDLLERSLSMS